ncbi:hypothetical protein Tco_1320587 [Tanacetum coccineum]
MREPTMEEYITEIRKDYGLGIARLKRIGDDKEVMVDDELSNPGDENLIEENEIAQIFRIKTNIFHFETLSCEAFKEFNYLLKIDVDVLTKDIHAFKTYEEYKDDWIYEWNNGIPWVDEKPWIDEGVWTEPADNIDTKVGMLNGLLATGRRMDIETQETYLD